MLLFTKPSKDRSNGTSRLKCCAIDLCSLFFSGLCFLCVEPISTKTLLCDPKMATASFLLLWLQPSCFPSTGKSKGPTFTEPICPEWVHVSIPEPVTLAEGTGCPVWLSPRSHAPILWSYVLALEVGRSNNAALLDAPMSSGKQTSRITFSSAPEQSKMDSRKGFRGFAEFLKL